MKTMRIITFLFTLVLATSMSAQTAMQVLDKTSAVVGRKGGASANFHLSSTKFKPTNGTFSFKGRKFHAKTPQSEVWYDGKTQWAYLASTDEVNISAPTQAEQMSMNPYTFLTIYKTGYQMALKTVGSNYEVHLIAQNQKRTIQELLITIGKDYLPKVIKMRQGKAWTTITVSNFQAKKLSDSTFRFNAKAYPQAEVIDLR